MTPAVERIVQRIRDAEEELSREVAEQRRRWHYRTRHGRVWFAREVRQDYGIPRVRLRSYMVADRHRRAYLNGIEKLNCNLRYHTFFDDGDAEGYRRHASTPRPPR